jgi:hypothetical protein
VLALHRPGWLPEMIGKTAVLQRNGRTLVWIDGIVFLKTGSALNAI